MDQKDPYVVVLVVMTHLLGIFLRVRGAPFPVHRQSGGHSCFMILHLADPVSCRKYSGAIVFTVPFAELTVMLFIVPLNGYTIVATAAVVPVCSSSADGPDSACGDVYVAVWCGGGCFLVVLTILFGTVCCR